MSHDRTPPDPSLAAALADLPRELPPPRDLWPDIDAQLPPRPARRAVPWRWGLALAAAALLAFALGRWGGGGTTPVPEAEDPIAQLRAAEARLEADLAARRPDIHPETLGIIDENLARIDDAIAQIEAALAAAPDDPELPTVLEEVHRHRVALLQTANRL